MKATLVINHELGIIKSNFEEVKAELQEYLKQYNDVVFTEDSKNIAKKFVASLRGEKKQAADRIREKKMEFMIPWNAFETQAKELLELYDKPIALIDTQVKAFDEKRREEKRGTILSLYGEYIGDMEEYLPLSKIYDQRWENVATSTKSIQEEMKTLYHSTLKAVEIIQSMNSEAGPKALAIYKRNLSLTDAINYINSYEQQKAEIIIKQRQEDEDRIRQEEREKVEAEQRAEAERIAAQKKAEEEKRVAVEKAKNEAAQEVIDGLIPDTEGESALYEYRVELTPDAKVKLEMYWDSVGIEWEMI